MVYLSESPQVSRSLWWPSSERSSDFMDKHYFESHLSDFSQYPPLDVNGKIRQLWPRSRQMSQRRIQALRNTHHVYQDEGQPIGLRNLISNAGDWSGSQNSYSVLSFLRNLSFNTCTRSSNQLIHSNNQIRSTSNQIKIRWR